MHYWIDPLCIIQYWLLELFLPHGFMIEQKISWNCFLFYQNQKCWRWWAKAERVQLHRNRLCVQDMNLKITCSMHFKSWVIFNITPSGNCCTSPTAGLPSTVAPVLNLQENSYPNPKEKSLSIKPEADLWSIKPPSMHSLWIKIKIDIPSKASVFLFCH